MLARYQSKYYIKRRLHNQH